jgi:hypothetical protein
MPFRFYRRFRVGPFRLNVSRGGISYSIGGRHAWLTLGHGHVRTSLGIPGTGLYWYQQRRLSGSAPARPSWLLALIALIVFAAIMLMHR